MVSRPAERPVSERDDASLVDAVREGDDRAFEELYERYRSRISAFVRPMVKDHQRTEDITQEVFLSALGRLRKTSAPIAFKPWLYEIARNACIDQHRRAQRAREVPLEEDFAEGGRPGTQGLSPHAALSAKEQIDDLCDAFAGLSPAQHEMLVMREFEGRSYRDIGERLNLTKPAVESALFRARRRLVQEYQELVSGDRCARVQRAITRAPASREPVRDWRIAMHLARCPGCRMHARSRGLRFVGTPPRRAAALLPLPALLPRLPQGGWRARLGAFWSGRSDWVVRWPLSGGGDMATPGLITAGAAAATVALALGSASVLGARDAQPRTPHAPTAASSTRALAGAAHAGPAQTAATLTGTAGATRHQRPRVVPGRAGGVHPAATSRTRRSAGSTQPVGSSHQPGASGGSAPATSVPPGGSSSNATAWPGLAVLTTPSRLLPARTQTGAPQIRPPGLPSASKAVPRFPALGSNPAPGDPPVGAAIQVPATPSPDRSTASVTGALVDALPSSR